MTASFLTTYYYSHRTHNIFANGAFGCHFFLTTNLNVFHSNLYTALLHSGHPPPYHRAYMARSAFFDVFRGDFSSLLYFKWVYACALHDGVCPFSQAQQRFIFFQAHPNAFFARKVSSLDGVHPQKRSLHLAPLCGVACTAQFQTKSIWLAFVGPM